MIIENKNEITILNTIINKINDNISNEIKNKQNENKEELKKLNNNIINERNNMLNKIYNIYIKSFDNKNDNKINTKNILSKQAYRVLIFGPTGVGKTQFCGFAKKNQKNIKMNFGTFDSYQDNIKSNIFTRLGINFEFIDFPGFEDDINNSYFCYKIRDYLDSIETIDYIILLFNFQDLRIRRTIREFIEYLKKIFLPGEFWLHCCIGFTHFYEEKEEDEESQKLQYNELLMEIFNPNKNLQLPDIQTYFFNTRYNEKKKLL